MRERAGSMRGGLGSLFGGGVPGALANALEVHLAHPRGTGAPTAAELEHFRQDLVAFVSGGLRAA